MTFRFLLSAAALLTVVFAPSAGAVPLLGLTEANTLIRFDSGAPQTLIASRPISGVSADDRLVGIAVRPLTLELYALARRQSDGAGKLYLLDFETGIATAGPALTPAVGAPADAATLNGTTYALNFDPSTGSLHALIDSERQLRIDPVSGQVAVAAELLPYAPGDPSSSAQSPAIGAIALSPTARFAIDLDRDVLATIGTDHTLATVGELGTDVTFPAAFALHPDGTAFAALRLASASTGSRLFTVDLLTGAATDVGPIAGASGVLGLAVLRSAFTFDTAVASVPEGGSLSLTVHRRGDRREAASISWALTGESATAGNDFLVHSGTVSFAVLETTKTISVVTRSDFEVEGAEAFRAVLQDPVKGSLGTPSSVRVEIRDDDSARAWALSASGRLVELDLSEPETRVREVQLSGLLGDERVVGLDARPKTRELLAVTDESRLYRIDTTTGAATVVSSAPFSDLSGEAWGVELEPDTDRLRVVTDTGRSLWVSPDAGTAVEEAALHYAVGDVSTGAPEIVALAASANDVTVGISRLYAIDAERETLAVFETQGGQPDSSEGRLKTVGSLQLEAPLNGAVSFDIYPGTHSAWLTHLHADGTHALLSSVDLQTGAATPIGSLPGLFVPEAFALELTPHAHFAASQLEVSEAEGTATLTVVRQGLMEGELFVDYATRELTATLGEDFTGTSGSLRFGAGERTKTITVDVFADEELEPDAEQFEVVLSSADPLQLGRNTVALVNLRDFDAKPGARVSDAQATEASGEVVFEVRLSAAVGREVRIGYETADGTARRDEDFVRTSGTLVFAPGETRKQVGVPLVRTPHDPEPIETFALMLKNPINAALSDAEGVATVRESQDGDFNLELSTGSVRVGDVVALTVTPTTQEITTPIGLSCADLPRGLRCEFSPGWVVPGLEPTRAHLRIVEEPVALGALAGGGLLGGLLLLLLLKRRKALILCTLAVAGCGGGRLPERGTYPVRIVASLAGGAHHEAQLKVTVE